MRRFGRPRPRDARNPAHQHGVFDAAPLPHGQGARRLRPGRRAAHRRDRSHLGVRLRARIGHPRQGQGAHAAVGVLVRPARRRRAESLHHDGRRDVPGGGAGIRGRSRRPIDAGAQDGAHRRRVRRAGVPCGLGLEGVSTDGPRVRHPVARRTRGVRSPARSDLHARHQGEHRARHQHLGGRRGQAPGEPGAGRAPPHADARTVSTRLRARRVARHHPGRHQVRVRADGCRRAAADRRGADARLVPLLAGRSVQAGRPAGRASTSSTSATTSKPSSGTSSRPCRRCPPTSSNARGPSTWRPSSASQGRRWSCSCGQPSRSPRIQ